MHVDERAVDAGNRSRTWRRALSTDSFIILDEIRPITALAPQMAFH